VRADVRRGAAMTSEDEVVAAVCRHLERGGYEILQRCRTSERGIDIVARSPAGDVVHVEAKGETSNDPSSKRFGKPFNRAQCGVHVASAFYTAAASANAERTRAAMAFPDTRLHREFVGRIRHALARLEIAIFWVAADHSVQVQRSID
jgi:Holliday junction resolvase-like predicted endonuclease